MVGRSGHVCFEVSFLGEFLLLLCGKKAACCIEPLLSTTHRRLPFVTTEVPMYNVHNQHRSERQIKQKSAFDAAYHSFPSPTDLQSNEQNRSFGI